MLETIPGEVYNIDNIKNEIVAENIRKKYQLDQSMGARYFSLLKNLLMFDFGNSFLNEGRAVNDIIAEHFPISALYGMVALIAAFLSSIIFSVFLSKHSAVRSITTYLMAIIISFPTFVVASLLQYWLCVKLKIFPVFGTDSFLGSILPILIIGLPLFLMFTRLFMDNMAEIRHQDYYIQAKSLRISKTKILFMYLIKNSLTSVLTYLGAILADLLVGSFIVETTFNIPGLGRYFINSITNRDYPVVMGLTMFYSILIICFTSFVDFIVKIINFGGKRTELYED